MHEYHIKVLLGGVYAKLRTADTLSQQTEKIIHTKLPTKNGGWSNRLCQIKNANVKKCNIPKLQH
jgi:hypothetical protein